MTLQNLLLRRRTAAMAQGGGGGLLPKGYTAYDWVECLNSQAEATSYIDTQYNVSLSSQPTLVFEGEVARAGNAPSNYKLCAVFTAYLSTYNQPNYGLVRKGNSSNFRLNYNARANGETYGGDISATISKGIWYPFNLHSTEGVTYGGTITFNGTDYSYTQAAPQNGTSSIKLLAGYPCRLARFKIYKANVLEADLVPALRDNDNAVGFYDVVRNIFCEPTGEATFTVGNGLENFTV